jgi:hypothetical protein
MRRNVREGSISRKRSGLSQSCYEQTFNPCPMLWISHLTYFLSFEIMFEHDTWLMESVDYLEGRKPTSAVMALRRFS